MHNRRNFIKNALTPLAINKLTGMLEFDKIKNIGIQLFSLPKLLEDDFLMTIKMLAKIGYTELEFFGPYSFSHPAAHEGWKVITPMLGFSGSGYFGKDIQEIKMILDDHDMTSPSAHTDLNTLIHHMDQMAEAAHILGHQYVILPAIPDDRRQSLDDYSRIAETFNQIGENAKKAGIKFTYHNHGYGIKPWGEVSPLEIIFNETDPELVFFEMDIYWTAAGGADPVSWLRKYGSRYRLLHIKDMKPRKEFSGDGNDAPQWIELFPFMTSAGDGDLGVEEIVETAQSTGVEHFIVEQDMVVNPERALARSFDFLNKKI
ncbi:MAG: sugar phosphate isomerase/epimerase [Saprospiraceae bacterium]|nr:sugar phosphate isomerase/epimerase [Saprospiraceae bacterium]